MTPPRPWLCSQELVLQALVETEGQALEVRARAIIDQLAAAQRLAGGPYTWRLALREVERV